MYFHATFISNVRGIMEKGLLKGAKRIWGVSGKNYIYLSDEPDDAADWMIYWYENKFTDALLEKYGKAYWGNKERDNEELDELLSSVPMIDDGLVVFAVDTTGMKVKPRYDITEDKPTDYVVGKNITPDRLRIVGYIYPEDVRARIKKHWGIP
jgi:hypothetical protein